jgi:hypothetical protein
MQHIKAQQALNEYQQKKPKTDDREAAKALNDSFESRKRGIQAMMIGGVNSVVEPSAAATVQAVPLTNFTEVSRPKESAPMAESQVVLPPLSGAVFTTNGIPLSGIMVYIKQQAETIRLFRTDSQGHFQNNLPLPPGEFYLELEDPQKKHTFARMKIDQTKPQLEIFAQT